MKIYKNYTSILYIFDINIFFLLFCCFLFIIFISESGGIAMSKKKQKRRDDITAIVLEHEAVSNEKKLIYMKIGR